MKWVEISFPVRYVETDAMGIVHHSNYIIWFEIGRVYLSQKANVNYSTLEKERKIFLPVISCECEFKEPARFGDEVVVRTAIEKPETAKLVFRYEIYRRKGRALLAKGKTVHALITEEGELIRKIPPELDQRVREFLRK